MQQETMAVKNAEKYRKTRLYELMQREASGARTMDVTGNTNVKTNNKRNRVFQYCLILPPVPRICALFPNLGKFPGKLISGLR